jgi:hypothetical protein
MGLLDCRSVGQSLTSQTQTIKCRRGRGELDDELPRPLAANVGLSQFPALDLGGSAVYGPGINRQAVG